MSNRTIKLPGGIGYKRGACEFWFDRALRLWTVYDPDTTDVIGYDTFRWAAEDLCDSYTTTRNQRTQPETD